MTAFAIEVGHYGALVPLAYLALFRRRAPLAYWLVAFGFAVSFAADALSHALGGSWLPNHYYPVLQFGLFAWAFAGAFLASVFAGVGAVLAVALPGPDVLVRTIGSLLVLVWSRGHALAPTVVAYAGVGTVLYLLMVRDMEPEAFMRFWWPYQTCRLAAFGLFVRAAWRQKEVPDG